MDTERIQWIKEALTEYPEAIQIEPEEVNYLEWVELLHELSGLLPTEHEALPYLQEAYRICGHLVQNSPEDTNYLRWHGAIADILSKFENDTTYLEAAIATYHKHLSISEDTEIQNSLAWSLLFQTPYTIRPIEHLLGAIELAELAYTNSYTDSDLIQHTIAIGHVMLIPYLPEQTQERSEKALELFKQVAETRPESFLIYKDLCELYEKYLDTNTEPYHSEYREYQQKREKYRKNMWIENFFM